MVPFAGWEMPVQFSGLVNEHEAVRKKAGLFDISHMGVLLLQGINAKAALQTLVPSDLYRIGPGEACYSVLLNHDGGILDDLIVYDLGIDEKKLEKLMVVINASCTKADTSWLKTHLEPRNIEIFNAKNNGILLALQGPESMGLLERLIGESLENLPRFGHRQIKDNNHNVSEPIFIARTGYTGEEGFEILLSQEAGKNLWSQLIQEGVTPCGLGARDTLRLEAGMHLYGNDMDSKTSPFEAGLGWLVHLEMPSEFIGRAALEQQAEEGIGRRLVGLKLKGRAIARPGYPVIHEKAQVGTITSGTWSPSLSEAIAMAYVPIELSKKGTALSVEIRGINYPATIVKRPFYRRA